MTFSLASNHDQTYTCPCGTVVARTATNVDRHTWTCKDCHQRVDILMNDGLGNVYAVSRHLARDIREDDLIVYHKGHGQGLASNAVLESLQALGKHAATGWVLAVANYGRHTIPAGQYINRIPG